MAKLSNQTKEIINIAIFLIVTGLLLFYYAIYPLNKTKTMMGRENVDNYHVDSLPISDPTLYIEAELATDTFTIETDGLTNIAALYINAVNDSNTTPSGTTILLHADGFDRNSMLELTEKYHGQNQIVITYDQRASGSSTGTYRGFGAYEGLDLNEIIRYFEFREKIIHPLTVVGFESGADAAMLTALEENRINKVVAVNPGLSTDRQLDLLKEKHAAMWFPFYRSVMFWWYEHRSSYATNYTTEEDISPVSVETIILVDEKFKEDEELLFLSEQSDKSLLTIKYFNGEQTNAEEILMGM